MKESKLLLILKTLDKKELKKLKKVFQSPYFVTNERLLSLFEYLQKCHPEFAEKKITKEKLFQQLYPGQDFNNGLLRVMLREFTSAVEEFVLMERLRNDAYKKKRELAREYGVRNILPLLEKETNTLKKDLKNTPYRDADFHREMASINFDFLFHPYTFKGKTDLEVLRELDENIDKHFILMKYIVTSEMKNIEKIRKIKLNSRFLPAINEEINKGYLKENQTAITYQNLFKLYEPCEEHENFFKLSEYLSNSIGNLKKRDAAFVATQITNYAIQQLPSEKIKILNELFKIYKLSVDYNLVIYNNQIRYNNFWNIVNIGCHEKEYDWVKEFIENYQQYITLERREDLVALSTARLHYSQNMIDSAYSILNKYSFSERYQLISKILLIKILFEKFERDPSLEQLLISNLESCEKYIKRTDNYPISYKVMDLNFIAIIKRLTNGIAGNKSRKKLEISIKKNIEKMEAIRDKKWILEKLDNLNSAASK